MVRAYVSVDDVPVGSGKTTAMFYDLRRFITTYFPNHNYKIVSNIPFSFTARKFSFRRLRFIDVVFEAEVITNKHDFFHALNTYSDTIFIIDEASVWVDEYSWKEVSDTFYERIKQTRKANIHLLYTVQFFELVAKRLRIFTDVIVECSPFPKPHIDRFEKPPVPVVISQTFRTRAYYQYKDKIYGDKEKEKATILLKKHIYFSEIKRTFPTFDSKLIVKNV